MKKLYNKISLEKIPGPLKKLPLLLLLIPTMAVTCIQGGSSDKNEDATNLALAALLQQMLTLEINGVWDTNFSSVLTVTADSWSEVSSFGTDSRSIKEFTNQDNTLIYQQSSDDAYNPSKYGRVRWTEPANNVFYYCTEVYGKTTIDEVKADTTRADESDPANSGCGGFSWTKATAQ